MYRVWNAPATCSGRSRAPAGGVGRERCQVGYRPGGHDLARGVDVRRGEAVLGDGREHLALVAAEHGRHPGRLGRCGRRHRLAAHP
jgi:hypothetical protein